MKIVFDNNIWISFLIGKRLSSLRQAFVRSDVEVYYCAELEHEFLEVSHRPKIQKYVNEQQIVRVHQLMLDVCHKAEISELDSAPVRDAKDVYLLSLCDAACVDFLVTGDADLLELKEYHQTKIVDFETIIGLLPADN